MQEVLDIDFTRVAELGNGLLADLGTVREAAPIVWNPSLHAWLVTRHEDVNEGFSGRLPLSCVRMEARSFLGLPQDEVLARFPKLVETVPNWIVNSDAPRHTRLRSLMTKAFGRRIVEGLRPMARATIAEVLDGLSGTDLVDFPEDVARQITGRVILHIFGLPLNLLPKLKAWALSQNEGLGGVRPSLEALDAVEQTIREMEVVFAAEIAARRETPRDDFLSALVTAREGDDQLTEAEILGISYLVIVAGHDTTLNTMALGTRALIQHPEQRAWLLDHPDQIGTAIMEVMRYVAMSTAFNRVALEDFEWHGAPIRKGDQVFLMTAGANRDPRAFDRPEELDLTRPTDRVLTFGAGAHHCIGHLLAKMQLAEFFPAFFTRFPDAALVEPGLDFQRALSFRGLERLPMRLGTAV